MPERKEILNEFQRGAESLPGNARLAASLVDDNPPPKESLLNAYGPGAGLLALGGLITKAKFAPRLAGRGLLAMGLHGLRRIGSKVGHSAVGGLAGAAVVTPMAYLSAKADKNADKDEKFDAKNFAQIAAPSAASGLLSYGMYSNISQSIAGADKTGYKGMVKNIVSPKRNIRYAKHGFKLIGKAFKPANYSNVAKAKPGFNLSRVTRARGLSKASFKGRAGGLIALGLLGLDAISPGMYLNKTLNNKKEDNNGRV